MKPCLLDPQGHFDANAALPAEAEALTQDLALAPLFATMAAGDAQVDAVARRALFAAPANDAAVVAWRHAVLADWRAQPERLAQLRQLADTALAAEKRAFRTVFSRIPESRLTRGLLALRILRSSLLELRETLLPLQATARSAGLQGLCATVLERLDEDFFTALDLHLEALSFPGGLLLRAGLDEDCRASAPQLCPPPAKLPGWRLRLRGLLRREPASYRFHIAPRDEAGNRALSELRTRGIAHAAALIEALVDQFVGFLAALSAELALYQGLLRLETRLQLLGAPLCQPALSESALACSAEGLYDVSLALHAGRPVVGNDLAADGQCLLIITGANQGGKSTFLRSLGQARLMAQAGFPVAARAASFARLSGVFTHFRREEDRQMRSGKLDEELARLSALLPSLRRGSLLLMNESFAATNEREGSEIAAEVVRALVEQGVMVVFVTHLYAFACAVQTEAAQTGRQDVQFLRAQRSDDGQRSFRLEVGEPLPTAWGQDLYTRIFGKSAPA